MDSILSHTKPAHCLTRYNSHSNTRPQLPSTTRSPNFLALWFWPTCLQHLSHAWYIPHQGHSSLCDHQTPHYAIFSFSYYVFSLRVRYFPVQLLFKHNRRSSSFLAGRSQWPRGLRRRSTAARLVGLRVRIPPGAWMFVCCECCVLLSDRGLYDELATRP